MATYEHKPNPTTYWEFAERCRKNIEKIRAAKDAGLYSNMYVNDVEAFLETAKNCRSDDLEEGYAKVVGK